MTDEIIKFETAKLAKEKGFDLPSTGAYAQEPEDGAVDYETAFDTIGELVFDLEDMQSALEHEFKSYLAPTQSLLQRWLREKHNLFISVTPVLYSGDVKAHYWYPTNSNCTIDTRLRFNTYEEALEIGLVAALKIIKV